MKEKLRLLLRKPAVIALLIAELLVIGFALAAALRPAAAYTFTADQWENIAQESEIGYDEDGRIGVTEMTDGEDILQTPAMTLPKGHYRVTVDYTYIPGILENGREHHACLYLKANLPYVVNGERELLKLDTHTDMLEFNVRHTDDSIRLVARNDGGIFTLGTVRIAQNMVYARACAAGWLLCFVVVDVLCLVLAAARDSEKKRENLGCWLCVAAVAALACAPIFVDGGGLWGDDCIFHLSRIEGITQGLREGQFPVRIYSLAKDGYGYASPMFYGELLLYFPAVLRLLGVSVQGAYHAYIAGVMALTAGIAFYSLRQIFKENRIALLGTALYLLAPYHLHNVYIRSAVGEYTAQAFLLLIPAALCQLYGKDPPTRQQAHTAWGQLVLAFAMLVQTHILTLELTALVCAVFCLLQFRRTFSRRVFGTWVKAAGTVVLLNAWFLVPFLTQAVSGRYKVLQPSSQADAFDIQKGALNLVDFLAANQEALGLGAEFLAGAAAFVWLAYTRKEGAERERRLGLWALGIGVIACCVSTSYFPWGDLKSLPVLGNILLKTQFSWRFLTLATPALVLVCCCAVAGLRKEKAGPLLAGGLACLSLVGALQFYRGYLPTMRTDYIGGSGQLIYANDFSNEAWLFDGLYLPKELAENRDGFENLEAVTTVEVTSVERENGVTTLTCTETSGQDQHAELPLLYYPGYTVIEGPGTAFKTANGLVGVTVPANYSGTIRVAFREPKRWLLADGVSVLTALVLVAAAVRRRRTGKGKANAK